MLKVYGISGQTTAIVRIPLNEGKAYLECEFRHGHIGSGPNARPATYPTSDPATQAIIESSGFFGKRIKLIRVMNDDQPKPTFENPAYPSVVAHPEITCKEEAVAYIKKNGAKAKDFRNDEAIQEFAAKIGVSFPNLYK